MEEKQGNESDIASSYFALTKNSAKEILQIITNNNCFRRGMYVESTVDSECIFLPLCNKTIITLI